MEDLGPLYAIRTQRAVLQQWKEDTPWAKAGQVVIANGGDVAREAGLFQQTARQESSGQQVAKTLVQDHEPVLSAINRYRVEAGVSPATINPALEQAARNHVAYYEANQGDPSLTGMGLHEEDPGKPGFTGIEMDDRARAAGYDGNTVTENAGFGKLEHGIEWAMNTVNHRLTLIHPGALDIGYAGSASTGFHIVSIGISKGSLGAGLPSVYPGPGTVGVPVSWDGAEAPDPAPGLARPLGYPITVAFSTSQRVEWKSFSLRGPDGSLLAISTPKKDWMRAAAIVPHKPLQPGATYNASVEAVVDGVAVVKDWSFTTQP